MRRRKAARAGLRAAVLALPALVPPGTVIAEPPSAAVVRKELVYHEAPFPQAHASTIVELTDGRIASAWFGGTHERHSDVSIWFAIRERETWSVPVEVASGLQEDGSLVPTWNPVLFQAPGADLFLFYKEGPSPSQWWGMVTQSSDGGRTWSPPERLPQGILGPIKNKPVVLPDGAWLSPSSVESGGWRLHVERSEDGGNTWRKYGPIASPEGLHAIQPSILFHPGGRLQMLARTRQGVIAMTWSDDGGKTWSPLAATALPNPNSGIDAVTLQDGRHLLAYNPTAHDPDRPGKGKRYPLNIAVSDDGLAWHDVLVLETDPVPSGYAYPAVIQASDGNVHVTYTHDRRRIVHVEIDPAKLASDAWSCRPPASTAR